MAFYFIQKVLLCFSFSFFLLLLLFFLSADGANVVGAKGDTSEKRSPFVPSVSIHILPTVLNKQMMTIKRVF